MTILRVRGKSTELLNRIIFINTMWIRHTMIRIYIGTESPFPSFTHIVVNIGEKSSSLKHIIYLTL